MGFFEVYDALKRRYFWLFFLCQEYVWEENRILYILFKGFTIMPQSCLLLQCCSLVSSYENKFPGNEKTCSDSDEVWIGKTCRHRLYCAVKWRVPRFLVACPCLPTFLQFLSPLLRLRPIFSPIITLKLLCKILAENSDQFEVITLLMFSTNRYKSPTNPQNIIALVIAHNIF